MRNLIVRLLLIGTATGAIVAACYFQPPEPRGFRPLPPTREAKPLAPKPEKTQPSVVQMDTEFAPQQEPPPAPPPTNMPTDAGVSDVVDLPPVPDAGGLDAPTIKNAPR
ncbi:MAG TPA: hypothetical protein VFV99_00005 [Kofleriaceae bacterium]|nr:hypothetical protein [Kofleriaceae bacterium]